MFEDFWDAFESQCAATGLASKVPPSIKKLLTLTGYNSIWSFKSITEQSLSEAEDFIETTYRKDADEFDEYKEIKPFKFLPGHKALIFGIKSEISEIQDTKKSNKINKSKPVLTENDIHTSLLCQMSSFTKGLGLQADWSNAIKSSDFTETENTPLCACNVVCPICSSSFIVRYDKHWKNSNISKHLRKHAERIEKEKEAMTELDKNCNESKKSGAVSSDISIDDMAIIIEEHPREYPNIDNMQDDDYDSQQDEYSSLG